MEDFTVMFGVKILGVRLGPNDPTYFHGYRVKTNEPLWREIRDKNVKDSFDTALYCLCEAKEISENVKRIIESGNFTIKSKVSNGSYYQLREVMLNRSLAEFVENFKFFCPDENEMIIAVFFN